MPDETQRSTSGADQTEEQKPSPEEYPKKNLGDRPEGGSEDEEADRSSRHAEASQPPRGDPGAPSDG